MKIDKPIYTSHLDNDFYKFTMGQVIFHNHPHIPVQFTFMNRTKSIRLGEEIDPGELREHLEECCKVRTKPDDLRCLMGTAYDFDGQSMFAFDYIKFFESLRLPEFHLGPPKDGQLDLTFFGDWALSTYWEVPAMFIVKKLYRDKLISGLTLVEREQIEKEGRDRLDRKIDLLSKHRHISFSDFGTRRRRSLEHQDYVVGRLIEKCKPQFRGTSDLLIAKKYGVMPMGTNAHEIPMCYSGIFYDEDEKDPAHSQRKVLEDWEREYGLALSIFLPDTFGSDWFFDNVATKDQLRRWKGSRNDSDDPIVYSNKMIQRYEAIGVDPMSKFIVDADGQVPEVMVNTGTHFKNTMPHTFGWGTDLTDDFGFPNVSIIVKPTRAAGHPVVKLSDNLEKATGDAVEIERAKRLRGYTNTHSEVCTF